MSINGVVVDCADDDALHVVGYLGDANGSQRYEKDDVTLIQRNVAKVDSGFAAWKDVDPLMVADIDGNGLLTSIDATRVNQELSGYDRPEVPPIPDPSKLAAVAVNGVSGGDTPLIDLNKKYPGFSIKSYDRSSAPDWRKGFVTNIANAEELNPNRKLRVTLDATVQATPSAAARA